MKMKLLESHRQHLTEMADKTYSDSVGLCLGMELCVVALVMNLTSPSVVSRLHSPSQLEG